jgi:uncharacterized protein
MLYTWKRVFMDNVYEIGLLLDFYGQLLTNRQYEIMDLHYNNDYSLAEIAEQLNISRQGVFDNIKKGKVALNDLEDKLSLVKRFTELKLKAEAVLKSTQEINIDNLNSFDRETVLKIEKGIRNIIETI